MITKSTETAADDELVDYRAISTKVAQRAIDRLLEFAEAKAKQRWAQYKNKTTSTFSRYIQVQRSRCRLIRTLIYNNQSTNLEKIFVPMEVDLDLSVIKSFGQTGRGEQFMELLLSERNGKETRRTFAGVLSGMAGAGKSFFMRHLYLSLSRREARRVPVFIEARELNSEPELDLAGIRPAARVL